MSKPTIHFVFTVPLGSNLFRRGIDRIIRLTGVTPLHRYAWDPLIPWQKPRRSVHAISYNLLQAFKAEGYPVRLYSLYEHGVCRLKPDDIFIGMPLPANGFGETRSGKDDRRSVTSRTIREYPRNKNFIIMPYSHDPMYVNWSKDLVKQNADQGGGTIFIGGEVWKEDWDKSPYADISLTKKIHAIMGIDPDDYPLVKKKFNPPGKRKYLYIGHAAWYKNTKELENIAAQITNFQGAHIGGGEVKGWNKLANFMSFTPEVMADLAKEYDIFVNVSTADPGATTILEQMCFGLVVACTRESGYEYPSLVKLSPVDTAGNVKLLNELQWADEAELVSRARDNREVAKSKHNWKQFTDSVIDFISN
jgi:glycosyltransferase involved in cell wall biosynthesis